jgi:hypothetical protein
LTKHKNVTCKCQNKKAMKVWEAEGMTDPTYREMLACSGMFSRLSLQAVTNLAVCLCF